MGRLFATFGIILILFGVIGLFARAELWIIIGHALLGLFFLVGATVRGLREVRELLTRDATRRGVRYGGNVALQTVIIGIILGLLAFLSVRHPVRWDWTEAKVHSLAQASLEVLKQIPENQPVEILAFYLRGGGGEGREALDLYSYASERVKVRIFDPNLRPDLAERYEIRAEGVIIVCAGACESAQGTVRVTEPSEEELTKAIRSVISERRKLYFLTGHGEGDPDEEEVNGFSRAQMALEDENIEVETVLLANLEEVPEDADGLIVAGPDHSLLDRELAALDRYLRGGGSVLVMAEPIVVSNLESQVRDWGIELGADIIVDQQVQLFAGPQLGVQPIISDYGSHPITEDLAARGSPTLFRLSRSVWAAEGEEGSEVVELARTGPASWAESDVERFLAEGVVGLDPEADREGPVAVAVAREFAVAEGEDAREGRLVVVGDADFARNRYIAEFFNADFFLNLANWLVGEEEFIAIERKRPRASRVIMSRGQLSTFRYLAIFVLPELILLVGVLNWWRRRT
jgi:ABC-type uncharacterized transport system involved in gliding motility auxiliary subunit